MISEPLLNAVLNIFAMQASRYTGDDAAHARRRVLSYLNHHVGLSNAEVYIGLYDELRESHELNDDAALLDQATLVATRLNAMLHGVERHVATLRFIELSMPAPEGSLARAIARKLGAGLGMTDDALAHIFEFIADPAACARHGGARLVPDGAHDAFRGKMAVLPLPGTPFFLVSPVGTELVHLEGRPISRGECHLVRPGQVLRDAWGNEWHYPRLAAALSDHASAAPAITLRGQHLDFRFPGTENGLHDFSFSEHAGRMVGIMGGSGAGKSTLLGILNGAIAPDAGELLLNGRNVHKEPDAIEGVIGFVPQDDLLFEDLTVFENLYYAARLCMAHLPDETLKARVHALLADLGQQDTAHLKVGSPLRKTISGGQRKRLNIALELIREPTVLFVDEPTSGLSSADSELVMSLLKEQAARGKLVFVVIHQPSSRIFRSFDALWMLDQGGWPVFTGSPLEAVAYFRSRGDIPGAEEAICPGCGSVNPGQVFDIIEEKLIDSAGHPTRERKVSPDAWTQRFRDYEAARPSAPDITDSAAPPEKSLHRPGRWGQFKTFLARDLRARLANPAYLAIALLQPPLLGFLLGLVSRGAFGGDYSFHENNNLHVFFFMSVITSLFLGLTVSAEEICRDGRILQRERFLHLSWWSYINAKSFYLAVVSAIQTLLYLLVAWPALDIPGMFFVVWLVMFAGAFVSCMLGLNISASFRSAVTIYILIPLVLIPQMLLCGVVIRYDDLIAPNTRQRNVPAYANLLPPRWAYEALVVEQYRNNEFMRPLFDADARVRMAEFQLDYHLPELQGIVQSVPLMRAQNAPPEIIARALAILRGEIPRLAARVDVPVPFASDRFEPDAFDDAVAGQTDDFIAAARRVIFAERRAASAARNEIEARREEALGTDGVEALRKKHTNRSIERQALNLQEFTPVGVASDGLFQRTLPIYQLPESRSGGAHFLASHKRLGDRLIPAFRFNLAAMFVITGLLYLLLCGRPAIRSLASASLSRSFAKR